jgi:sugar phosphate isomerase/epimerase
MLYISTGGIKNNTAYETSLDFYNNGITFIELSGGSYSKTYRKDLIKLSAKINFQVHNYFPPPKDSFVFNLASTDSKLRKRSIRLAINSMSLAIDLHRPIYSFHAGFRMNPGVLELGKTITKTTLCKRDLALEIFGESVLFLSEEARKKGVKLLIENNVLDKRNLDIFGEDPLLLTCPQEINSFFQNMPSNIGLLMDVGHLKVSSNSLNFNKGEGLKSLKKYIKGYHLSDNDGIFDSNNKIHKDSWFWDFIDGNQDYYSIEVYRFQTNQLCEQYKLVKELLNKKNELCIKKNT